MTGRDLIMYIMKNHLEDRPVFEDDKFIGFITVDEAAAKFEVGSATVNSWIMLGLMDGIQIGNAIYIPDTDDNYKKVTSIHLQD